MPDADSSEITNPKNTEGLQVQADIAKTVDHLRAGRATRKEAVEVKDAATRALTDMDVARSVRNL